MSTLAGFLKKLDLSIGNCYNTEKKRLEKYVPDKNIDRYYLLGTF